MCVPVLCLLTAGAGWTQQDMGVITGLITDPSSAAVEGATVKVVNQNTNEVRESVSSEAGSYTVGPLRVGTYNVTVEKPGFNSAVWQAIEVHAQDRVRADFKLQVGQVSETISVTAESPLLQAETSSLSHVVEQREIRALPLNGRSFQKLAWLTAGVAPNTVSRDAESGFNSHGQPAMQNNFQVDGIDNMSHVMGLQDLKLQVIVPSLDAVAEFKVQTSNYSAEFGRNSGAVMIVNIKSGSNQFHGSAYEYTRNDVFDSRDMFNYVDRDGDGKADPEVLRQHQFGATLGGPIRRDRTFFFFSWERLRTRKGQADLATVPTLDERNGIFNPALRILRDPVSGQPFPGNRIPRDRFDDTAEKLLDLWPQPNLFTSGTRANFASNPDWSIDRDQFDTRVDHNLSEADKLFVRVSLARYNERREGVFPAPARGDAGFQRSDSNNPARSLAFSYTRIVRPTLVNEFRYGFSRQRAFYGELSKEPFGDLAAQYGIRGVPAEIGDRLRGLPRFAFAGGVGYTGLGEPGSMPNGKISQVHQFVNNVSWNRGTHNFRIGGDIRFNRSDADIGTDAHGNFSFNGQYTNISLGDFILGRVSGASLATWLTAQARFRDYMFFVQDDWKVTPRLTVNLGLRYELDTPWYEKHNHMTQLDIAPGPNFGKVIAAGDCGDSIGCRAMVDLDTNNWAPRVGLAYQVSGRSVLRAGFGMFYGGQGARGADGRPVTNFPYTTRVSLVSTPAQPALQLSQGLPPNLLGTVTSPPANLDWRVWEKNFPLPTIYQWNVALQRELGHRLSFTAAYVGSSSNFILGAYNWNGSDLGPPATEASRRRIPGWNAITLTAPYAHSTYHGLDLQLERRYAQGLSMSASYTWGHSLDNVVEQFGAGGGGLQNFRNFSESKANSNFDVRHRATTMVAYELPFGKGRRWINNNSVVDGFLGGWQVSGILAAQTGHYFTITVPNPLQRLGASGVGNWWPDRVGSGRLDSRTADRWFDRSAFVLPRDTSGAWHLGNAGRAILNSDGPFNLDFGVNKSFAIKESVQLQFRAEVFNLTNTPTIGDPITNIESPDFATVRSTRSIPRQLQFALRLSF